MFLTGTELNFFFCFLLDLLLVVMEIIQVMFEQETVALAVNSHGFAYHLMNIGIGLVLFPQTKRCNNIDALNNVQNLI